MPWREKISCLHVLDSNLLVSAGRLLAYILYTEGLKADRRTASVNCTASIFSVGPASVASLTATGGQLAPGRLRF